MRVALAIAVAFLALAPLRTVSQPVATPVPTSCAYPNVSAATIDAVEPEYPPLAGALGVQGTVQVLVSLDAFSHLVALKIYSSPSALLNNAALAAARASTFQTQIVNCHPLAANYLYSLNFTLPATPPPTANTASVLPDDDANGPLLTTIVHETRSSEVTGETLAMWFNGSGDDAAAAVRDIDDRVRRLLDALRAGGHRPADHD
jgi:hypothetical protein